MSADRCTFCGGWPPPDRRLTLARAKTGDKLFCGYLCYRRWDAQQTTPTVTSGGDE